MHAAYNTQILVINGFVFSYYISQSRTDLDDFIPTLDAFYDFYQELPKRICADAGYGSLLNYSYLDDKQIGNYVKHKSWEGNMSGKYPDCYYLNDDGTIICLNNKIGFEVQIINRHPKKKGAVFFKIEGCNSCNFMYYCKRYMNYLTDDFKIIECNKKLQFFKQQANTNLLSPKGIELRVNRSIQVEGVFGIQNKIMVEFDLEDAVLKMSLLKACLIS